MLGRSTSLWSPFEVSTWFYQLSCSRELLLAMWSSPGHLPVSVISTLSQCQSCCPPGSTSSCGLHLYDRLWCLAGFSTIQIVIFGTYAHSGPTDVNLGCSTSTAYNIQYYISYAPQNASECTSDHAPIIIVEIF